MKRLLKKLGIFNRLSRRLDNLVERTEWVQQQLQAVPAGMTLLDAGCGSQQFREFAAHLDYKAQDFGQYTSDDKKMLGADEGGVGGVAGYSYGKLDYTGDIWNIAEKNEAFDVILCTEVFEHIPYPIETLREFARLLKPGGKLILTAPSNCLRHMDPYFFYTGFSDRWYEYFLRESGLRLESIAAVGDYYSWIGVELFRTSRINGIIAGLLLLPAFVYFMVKKKTQTSVDTLCMGYHVVAVKERS